MIQLVQASALAVLKYSTKWDLAPWLLCGIVHLMATWLVGKRIWYLTFTVAVVVALMVILARVVDYELVAEHVYPEDAIYENSNVTLRGIVTSVEQNHKSYGFGIDLYHIFRFYIQLNVTEVVWVDEDLAGSFLISTGSGNIVGIGYDSLSDPQFSVGQVVECRGFYLASTDSPYSFIITVAPSVSGSYVELQG